MATLVVPQASLNPSAVLSPISTSSSYSSSSSSSSSSLSSLSISLKLPEFRGLKVNSTSSIRPVSSVSSRSRIVPRSARIVCDSSETATQVSSVTVETWKSLVMESDLPVMVEFWAPWCGPCRIIQPIIDELSKEFAGKIKAFKVNTDESPTIASDYGIRSIPTVIIFKNGKKKEAIIGAVPKSTLTANIEKFL